METTTKVQLPEVPEGYYWKIGNMPKGWGRPVYTDGYDNVQPDPAVMLMKRGEGQEEWCDPIYKKSWWSGQEKYAGLGEPYMRDVQDSVFRAKAFNDDWKVATDADVPPAGIITHHTLPSTQRLASTSFKVKMSDDGIVWIAEKIMEEFRAWQKREEYYETEAALRDKYYGEYPPKVLGDND